MQWARHAEQGGTMNKADQFGATERHEMRPDRASARRVGQVAVVGLLLVLGASQLSDLWAPQRTIVAYEAGSLVATDALESVLYDPTLGGREEGPSVSRIFKDKAGQDCRRFVDGLVSGTACQRHGDWRVVEISQK